MLQSFLNYLAFAEHEGNGSQNVEGAEIVRNTVLVTSGHSTVVEINGIYGSLRTALQDSEVLSELKLCEKGLKIGLFNLRLEVCGKNREGMFHYCNDV